MTKELLEATCEGGPMHGKEAHSRFPEGFLLVDPERDRAWVYDYKDDSDTFVCREPAGVELHRGKAWDTAEEPRYDVLAFDPETMVTS